MSNLIEVNVPDIGDFKDVPVIDVLVKPGDSVAAEDPLIAIESDKATMEVPSPNAGVVKELKVKVGDKVSEGSPILVLEADTVEKPVSPASPPGMSRDQVPARVVGMVNFSLPEQKPPEQKTIFAEGGSTVTPVEKAEPEKTETRSTATASSSAATYTGRVDISCQMLVLGAGPGGYSAAFRAADLGMDTVLVERYASLGGVCLNVGCIPSKALLHVAAVMDEAAALAAHGIRFSQPEIDLDGLRGWKDKVVAKLTGGLAGMAKARKVTVVTGVGRFLDPHHLEASLSDGSGKKVIHFDKAVIAAGSQAMKLPFAPDDPRVVDSTGALELAAIPKRMLVIGGGIIGLEMATVYSTLGTRIDVVEMLDGLMQGADRDLVRVWQKMNEKRFDKLLLNTKTVTMVATPEGLLATFAPAATPPASSVKPPTSSAKPPASSDNKTATAASANEPAESQLYDLVLVSVGRSPNGKTIGAENAGVAVSERGFIEVDTQMRTNVPHIHAIGDIVGQPMLAHKAVHEGHVAAEAAAGQKSYFDARVIPSVAYTDPELAWVGLTEEEASDRGIAVAKSLFPWAASGRAIANGRDEGFTKLLFDAASGRIVGGGIVGTRAGDLISEIVLAIEMGADAVDIGKTIHPHPTLSESIGMAAEVFEGVCTDLPRARKQ